MGIGQERPLTKTQRIGPNCAYRSPWPGMLHLNTAGNWPNPIVKCRQSGDDWGDFDDHCFIRNSCELDCAVDLRELLLGCYTNNDAVLVNAHAALGWGRVQVLQDPVQPLVEFGMSKQAGSYSSCLKVKRRNTGGSYSSLDKRLQR